MARNPVPRQDGYAPDPRQPQQVRTHQGHQQAYPQTNRGWPTGDGQPPPQYHPQGQGPAGYDLGSYASGSHAYGVAAQRQVMDLGSQDAGLSALDRGARRGPQAPDLASYAVPQHGTQPQDGIEYTGEEYYEPEPEPPRSRKWLIVGTLVGAIAVGGGMAYAYRKFTEPRTADGRTPVVAANKTPVKARPTDAAGKEVAQPEKKFLNKLGDSSSEQASGRAIEDGVPRKVATYAVGKDGTLIQQAAPPPPAQNSQSQPSKQAPASIPGMIVDMPAPRIPQGAPQAEAPAPQPQSQPQPRTATQQPLPQPRVESGGAPPVQPKVIQVPPRVAAVQPAPIPQPQPQPQAQAAPLPVAPQQRQPVPKERPAVPQTATGAGFVAALISKRSQMEALTAMADFQQRYAQALQGRTATVQEANLGEKGVWYRVVVGPPGSREAANTVCTQLKGQGYQGCWITSY